jgi:hypothetical protein
VLTGLEWENLKEGGHLEDPAVDGRIILNGSSRGWVGGIYWTDLAQDRDKWRALLYTVMNFRVPLCGEFLEYLGTF